MFRTLANLAGKATFVVMLLVALALGTVYGLKQRDTPAGIASARIAIETLAERWQFADIAPQFNPVVLADADLDALRNAFAQFHRLGRLKALGAVEMSSYSVRYTLNEGFHRSARLRMIAQYENGTAAVTITLITNGGVARLQHMDFKVLRMPEPETPRRLA